MHLSIIIESTSSSREGSTCVDSFFTHNYNCRDITTQQEEFSYAYLEAIVTAAGYSIHRKPTAMDNAGIDVGVEATGAVRRAPYKP